MIRAFFAFLFFSIVLSSINAEPGKVVVISNFLYKSCGIAEHSRQFVQALETKNVNVLKKDFFQLFSKKSFSENECEKIIQFSPDIVNVHWDPQWIQDQFRRSNFLFFLSLMQSNQIPVVMTFHEESNNLDDLLLGDLLSLSSSFVFYFHPKLFKNWDSEKCYIFDLPAFSFSPTYTKSESRRKYGYQEDDLILTSSGITYPRKKFPEIIRYLSSILKNNQRIKLQLLVSAHQNNIESRKELAEIIKAISECGLKDRIFITGKYVPTEELLERIYISDLGFSWCDQGLYSSSGIEKDYVSARVPLIINDSEHFHLKNNEGVVRVEGNIKEFIKQAINLINNKNNLNKLSEQMDETYKGINYDIAAEKYLRIFSKLISKKKSKLPINMIDPLEENSFSPSWGTFLFSWDTKKI